MPHSQQGKDTTSSKQKQHHRRSGSHYSKRKQEKPKQAVESVPKSQPIIESTGTSVQTTAIEQPQRWSQWYPADDARWFWQARQKVDGSWEYQFAEGYPTTSKRRGPNSYATALLGAAVQQPHYNPPVAAGSVPGGASEAHTSHQGVMDNEQAIEDDDDDDQDEDETQTELYAQAAPPQVLNFIPVQQQQYQSQAVVVPVNQPTRPPPSTTIKPGSASQALVRNMSGRGGKKKLSAIVKADKGSHINSRRRVKTWLDGVTP